MILEDDKVGEAARGLWADTQAMLQRLIGEEWLRPRGVVGFWPANSDGDDIVVWTDETRKTERARFFTLRQQMEKTNEKGQFALSDFVAPIGAGADYVGGFAVTAGHGEAEKSAEFVAKGDDYSSIMVKALADRFAEAFAEALHERVRREFWGYAPDEALTGEDLIAEKYRGIRPAPGYPSQPDHTEKTDAVQSARCDSAHRHRTHIVFRHDAAGQRVGPLSRPTRSGLFRRRPDRERPGRGLCPPQGLGPRHRRTLARADPELLITRYFIELSISRMVFLPSDGRIQPSCLRS